MKRHLAFLKTLPVVFVALCAIRCTSVMVYATDHTTEAVTKKYTGDAMTVYEKSKKALENLGYDITSADDYQYQITTGWRPVKSDSHYLELFKRKDYAASDGSYYQLAVNCVSEGSYTRVDVKTTVKSAAGKLSSSKSLEKSFLSRLDDALRSPQIQVTNVGVENR